MSVIVITGTSTGLGLSIAVNAAKSGMKVYATMRNLAKREGIDSAASSAGVAERVTVLQLDVTDTASVEACVSEVIKREGKIDVLVNNAGVGFVRTTEQATEEDIKWVMDCNFHGVVRCVKAVLPHMRAAGPTAGSKIITVSSVGGLIGQPFNEIYCGSKFAVEGYMESMAGYVGPTFGIAFTLIEAGGMSSEFANSALKHFADTGGMLEDAYAPLVQKYIDFHSESKKNESDLKVFQTPDEVAAVVLDCVGMADPPVRRRTSPWGDDLCDLKTASDPDGKKAQAMVLEKFLGGGLSK